MCQRFNGADKLSGKIKFLFCRNGLMSGGCWQSHTLHVHLHASLNSHLHLKTIKKKSTHAMDSSAHKAINRNHQSSKHTLIYGRLLSTKRLHMVLDIFLELEVVYKVFLRCLIQLIIKIFIQREELQITLTDTQLSRT